MEGYKHLITVLIFAIGIFFTNFSRTTKIVLILLFSLSALWIDLDHYKLGFKTLVAGFFDINNKEFNCTLEEKEKICFLHKPILFYSLFALTLGVYIHFKMDGVL